MRKLAFWVLLALVGGFALDAAAQDEGTKGIRFHQNESWEEMLKLAQKKGVKIVMHFHFGRIPELFRNRNREWRRLVQVLKLADQVVVMDEKSYSVLRDNGYLNVVYVPNPLAPEVLEMADVYKGKRKERTLLFAGHVVENKGVVELVEACKDIAGVQLRLFGKVVPEMEKKLWQ